MRVVQKPVLGPTWHFGPYRIHGTVEKPDTPVSKLVHLYREGRGPRAGNLFPVKLHWVATQRSLPETGAFDFTHLSNEYTYTVMSFDSSGEYDPTIKAGLIPEPM